MLRIILLLASSAWGYFCILDGSGTIVGLSDKPIPKGTAWTSIEVSSKPLSDVMDVGRVPYSKLMLLNGKLIYDIKEQVISEKVIFKELE